MKLIVRKKYQFLFVFLLFSVICFSLLKSWAEEGGFPVTPVQKVEAYDDVRWKDLSKIDFSDKPNLIATLNFNLKTLWPPKEKMPKNIDPKELMEAAKNPGLGIRELHKEGITGKGVNVAIIDQNLYTDHPEFAGKILIYKDFGCNTPKGSMHGPAVLSLLVGGNIGTAPGARVYFAAAPSWLRDASYYAEALEWIIEINKTLPKGEKIRAVSVSAAPSENADFKNKEKWEEAVARAEKEGLLVLDCSNLHGFIGPCWCDAQNPEDVSRCTPGFPGQPFQGSPDRVLAPVSPRTMAEEYIKGQFAYQYDGVGGLSWAIPYSVGVMALGWQVRPELTKEEMRDLLFKSAYVNKTGQKIINPKEFIRLVKDFKK